MANGDSDLPGSLDPTFCPRCTELCIPDVYDAILPHLAKRKEYDMGEGWSWFMRDLTHLSDDTMNVMAQRLIFDPNQPPIPTCDVCKHLVPSERESSMWKLQSTDKSRSTLLWSLRQRTCFDSDDEQNETFSNRPAPTVQISADAPVVELQRSENQEVNFPAVRQLLDLCDSWHPDCSASDSPELETILVIDVIERRLIDYPKQCKYVALSYVWGGAQSFPFNREALPNYTNRTIEDAMLVVQRLGLRYLWIDAICINQKDVDHLLSQINIMNLIYSGACVSIVALTGTSAGAGLPGVSSPRTSREERWATFGNNRLVSSGTSWVDQYRQSPWSRRAWTFQEGLFSHRCLVWGDSDVFFICKGTQVYADRPYLQGHVLPPGANPTFNGLFPKATEKESPRTPKVRFQSLSNLITQYIGRLLTHNSDRLRAFTGVLEELRRSDFPDGFFMGLPRHDVRAALGWMLDHDESDSLAHFDRNICLPSWTWAGWQIPSGRQGVVEWPVNTPVLHPPLSIENSVGEGLCIEEPPAMDQGNTQSWSSISESAVRFKAELKLCDAKDMVTSLAVPSDSTLDVRGVLLNFSKVHVPVWTGRTDYMLSEGGHPFEVQIDEEIWEGSAHVNNFENTKDDLGPQALRKSLEQPLLLLGIYQADIDHHGNRFAPEMLELRTLQLRWERGIAYRCGVVRVWVHRDGFDSIYEWDPRVCRFLLG